VVTTAAQLHSDPVPAVVGMRILARAFTAGFLSMRSWTVRPGLAASRLAALVVSMTLPPPTPTSRS
jgi:hypothetical protein